MTLQELLDECNSAAAIGLEHTALFVPRGTSLRGFPRGELMCETTAGRVVRFKISALRRFAARVST